jgi:septum formation protein
MPRLILASASPRRAELLRSAAIDFEVQPADVDESVRSGETPEQYVCRVAREKARVAAQGNAGAVVLAADTTVVVDGHILAKPEDDEDARRMLRLLAGRSHQVLTGVCVIGNGAEQVRVESTLVTFAPLTDQEIDCYVASGEPADKAGAYAIQGIASRFITRIDGSYSNVVGLPVAVVDDMLRKIAPVTNSAFGSL